MNLLSIENLIKENKILLFYYDEKLSKKTIFIRALVSFLLLPIVILAFCYYDNLLIIDKLNSEGYDMIGLAEDYLFISFALITTPFLLIILKIIMDRFLDFLREIPSFTNDNNIEKCDKLIENYISYVSQKRISLSITKYIFALLALYSNISAIYWREGGWNSSSHMTEFLLTVFILVIVVGIILPQILMKYLIIIIAQIKLTKDLQKENLLEVKPLAPDKSGGLKSLGELSLSFTYFLIPFMIQVIAHYFTWRTFTFGFTLGLLGLAPLTTFVFFYPLGIVHNVMKETKRITLQSLSEKYINLNKSILDTIDKPGKNSNFVSQKENIELLDNLYSKADAMPVWPFNMKTLTSFIAVAFGPIIFILIEMVVQHFLKKFF